MRKFYVIKMRVVFFQTYSWDMKKNVIGCIKSHTRRLQTMSGNKGVHRGVKEGGR